ncbi:F420-dependent methylene-tetrahydromethanopterin reductase, partial [Streptomyces rubiginosohelvolus]
MPATAKKQVHLAAQLPGIHNVTVWSDPRSESQIAVDSFIRLAQTIERGKFDFFFLAEG